MFRNRSVIETMVLIFTLVVAFVLLATGTTVVIIEINNPEADTGPITNTLLSLVSGILGALLGLIAGKANGVRGLDQRPDDKPKEPPS